MSLNTRKKRKKNIREDIVEQDSPIFNLPDETFLVIFQYLSIEDVIHISAFVETRF